MQKIIFLGTDLHGPPTELAAKTVRDITSNLENNFTILSIQNRKDNASAENVKILPRFFRNKTLRKILQGIFLWFNTLSAPFKSIVHCKVIGRKNKN